MRSIPIPSLISKAMGFAFRFFAGSHNQGGSVSGRYLPTGSVRLDWIENHSTARDRIEALDEISRLDGSTQVA